MASLAVTGRRTSQPSSTVAVSRPGVVASRTVTWRAWFAVTWGHLLPAVVVRWLPRPAAGCCSGATGRGLGGGVASGTSRSARLMSSWPPGPSSRPGPAGAPGRVMSPHRWLRTAACRSWARAARAVCRQTASQVRLGLAFQLARDARGPAPPPVLLPAPGHEHVEVRPGLPGRGHPRGEHRGDAVLHVPGAPGVLRRHARGRVPVLELRGLVDRDPRPDQVTRVARQPGPREPGQLRPQLLPVPPA